MSLLGWICLGCQHEFPVQKYSECPERCFNCNERMFQRIESDEAYKDKPKVEEIYLLRGIPFAQGRAPEFGVPYILEIK